jgi:hypothetical protein
MCSFGTRNYLYSHWFTSMSTNKVALPLTLSHVTILWLSNKGIIILLLQIFFIFLSKQNKNYIKCMPKCVMIIFLFFYFRLIPLMRDNKNSIYVPYLSYIYQYKRNVLFIVASKITFQMTHVYRRLSDEEKTM